MPLDPQAATESHDYVAPDDRDFEMDFMYGDPLDEVGTADTLDDADTLGHVCPNSLPRV